MPLVSILIPAYNAEKYIRECLDSVIGQTLRDIEVIIVDDCSTDRTTEILAEYAAWDERVKFFQNEQNSGTTFSRHKALINSEGRYIMHLDADDQLEPDACEFLSAEMKKNGWDVLNFGTSILADRRNGEVSNGKLYGLEKTLAVPDGPFPCQQGAMLNLLAQKRINNTLWNKIYRREVVEQALSQYRGERILLAEDILLLAMTLAYTSSFGSIQKKCYKYRVGSGASTVARLTPDYAKQYAVMGRAYTLLKVWLPQTGLSPEMYSELLESDHLHSCTITSMLNTLLVRAAPSLCPDMLSEILEYMTPAELGAEVDRYVFREKRILPENAVTRLHGMFPSKTFQEIKTVALYYTRLYNGGIERVISLLASILSESGYRVIVLTDAGQTEDDYPLKDNVEHIHFELDEKNGENRFESWAKVIKELSIDCVIYNDWIGENVIRDSLAIKSCSVTLLLYAHGSFVYPYLNPAGAGCWSFHQKEVYSLFDLVLTLSTPDQAWCAALGMRSVQVNSPLMFSLAETAPAPLDGQRVLWVGRLSEEEQYEDAFEIARIVHEKIPEAEFHFVGGAENEERMACIVESLYYRNMRDYIFLDGYHKDIREDYCVASVYLCTSQYEVYPMAIQEAKVYGLPIVSYELPNVTMLQEPASGVFMIPQGNIIFATEQIITLLKNEDLRKEAGRQSRESIERLYDYDPVVRWQEILALACQEPIPEVPAYLCTPLETEVRMAMDNICRGFSNINSIYEQKIKEYKQDINKFKMDQKRQKQEITKYRRELHKIKNSTSFKAGRLLSWPLRKIKKVLKRITIFHKE